MSRAKPVSSQRPGGAQPEAGLGMAVKTPRKRRPGHGRAGTPSPLVELAARNGGRRFLDTRQFDLNALPPLAWPQGFEPAAVLKGYLDGLADTPNHTRRDEAYWYGHLDALVDRQPGKDPKMGKACRALCH